MNPCTQMAIRFSTEMNIESKNFNITIFVYSKIEKRKFNTNLLLSVFLIQITKKQNVKFLFNNFYFHVC